VTLTAGGEARTKDGDGVPYACDPGPLRAENVEHVSPGVGGIRCASRFRHSAMANRANETE